MSEFLMRRDSELGASLLIFLIHQQPLIFMHHSYRLHKIFLCHPIVRL